MKKIENEKALLKSALDYEQIQMFNEEKREFIKIKHDLTNIITTAQGFIEIGKPDKALEIFKNTNKSLREYPNSVSAPMTPSTQFFT